MKPIGIGQIKRANRNILGRHDLGHTPPIVPKTEDPTKLNLEHVTPSKSYQEQEGQLSVDVYQTDSEIVIVAPIAGTASDQINISITDDVITIKGRRQIPTRDEIRTEDFYIQECFWGNFSRSIILPAAVDTNHVQAYFKNNILTIRIPKIERVRTRMIKINE